MDNIIRLYFDLRSKAKKHGNELKDYFSAGYEDDHVSFFGMAFNSITLTLELLDHYYQLWRKINPSNCSNIEEVRKQNGERAILLQKMCFIELMSSFEFISKKIVLSKRELFGAFNGRIYLKGIMKRSHEKGLINATQLNLWEGAYDLRNSLVHNNGIAEKNKAYNYPLVTVTLNKDTMTHGDLDLFGKITDWLLDESKKWIKKC